MSRKRAAVLGTGIASVLVAGGMVFAPAASAEAQDSAYALAADGIIDITPVPHVVGSGKDHLIAADLPGTGKAVLHAGVFNAYADKGKASASTAELKLELPGVPVIEANLIRASCEDLEGTTSIADLRIGDQQISLDQIKPNTNLVPAALEGIASITLNKQDSNGDGSLTVTALEVNVLKKAPVVNDLLGQSIDLSSATCGKGDGKGDDGGDHCDHGKGDHDGDNGHHGDRDRHGDKGHHHGDCGGDNGGDDNGDDDGDNGDNGGDDNGDGNGGDDNGDDGNGDGGDQADENGNAPAPTPRPGHLDVTG